MVRIVRTKEDFLVPVSALQRRSKCHGEAAQSDTKVASSFRGDSVFCWGEAVIQCQNPKRECGGQEDPFPRQQLVREQEDKQFQVVGCSTA